jgi:type II secretory pathway component HofQ
MSVMEMVDLINSEDRKVAEAVGLEKEHIAQAIDIIYWKLSYGGKTDLLRSRNQRKAWNTGCGRVSANIFNGSGDDTGD